MDTVLNSFLHQSFCTDAHFVWNAFFPELPRLNSLLGHYRSLFKCHSYIDLFLKQFKFTEKLSRKYRVPIFSSQHTVSRDCLALVHVRQLVNQRYQWLEARVSVRVHSWCCVSCEFGQCVKTGVAVTVLYVPSNFTALIVACRTHSGSPVPSPVVLLFLDHIFGIITVCSLFRLTSLT